LKKIHGLVAAFCATASFAVAAPGDLDPSYGVNGVAAFKFGPSPDALYATAIQPDGKILSAGYSYTDVSSMDVALVRQLPDGTLDSTFGVGGRVIVNAGPGTNAQAMAILLQSDGKIVTPGLCSDGLVQYPCVFRFLPNGALDSTFGTAGLSRLTSSPATYMAAAIRPDDRFLIASSLAFQPGVLVRQLTPDGNLDAAFGSLGQFSFLLPDARVAGVVIQGDSKIVVTGRQGDGNFFAARMLPTGAMDGTFGAFGIRSVAIGQVADGGISALQPDGKLVLAGCSYADSIGTGYKRSVVLLRLDPNGQPDAAFGIGGLARQPLANPGSPINPGSADCVSDVAIQPDGRIAMTGWAYSTNDFGPPDLSFVRTLADGAPDTSFGAMGHARIPMPRLLINGRPEPKLALDGTGRMIAGVTAAGDFALVRVLVDGAADTTLHGDGQAITNIQVGTDGNLAAARRMADGRVVLVAHSSPAKPALIRLLPDGILDPTFGTGGWAMMSNVPLPVRALALQADGKILIVGDLYTPGLPGAAGIVRINADGSIDTTFGVAGLRRIEFPGSVIAYATAVEVLADGRIAVTGHSPGNTEAFLARLTTDGALDPSFGNAGLRMIDVAPETDRISTLAIQPDGRVVAGGIGHDTNADHVIAVRTLPNGDLDSSFASGGRFMGPTVPGISGYSKTSRVVLQPDGKALLLAELSRMFTAPGNPCVPGDFSLPMLQSAVLLMRLDAQGNLDPSFGNMGVLVTTFGALDAFGSDLALDAQGRILLTGLRRTSPSCTSYHPYVARLAPSGALDTSFGIAGISDMPGTGRYWDLAQLMMLPGDAILVAANTGDNRAPLATMRLLGGGTMTVAGLPGDLDGDGLPDSAESTLGRDMLAKDNDVFGDPRLFAMQQFRDFLGREGDAAGVAFWAQYLTLGTQSRGQVIENFLASSEFQGTIAPVARLYFAYFLRIPDYDGLNFWIGYYRGGNSLEAVSGQFAGSPEFVNRYGALDNGQFVDLVYQNVLGRLPDAGGRAFWQGELDSGARTRGQVMLGFSESAEYRNLTANEIYVTMTYIGMLRRAPDPGGFSFWVNSLDGGGSGLALIDGFLASPEYHGRFF
jgi:uncharacterized delta-60 repeat protein